MATAMRACVAAMGMIAVVGVAGPALAKITQYECRFPQDLSRGGGWIPEMLVLTEDDQTGKIMVFDPVIKNFIGEPIEARLSDRTKVRSTFGWEVETRNQGQAVRMIFTLSYFSNGRPAKMSAQPGGYDNRWTDEGTCKLSQG